MTTAPERKQQCLCWRRVLNRHVSLIIAYKQGVNQHSADQTFLEVVETETGSVI